MEYFQVGRSKEVLKKKAKSEASSSERRRVPRRFLGLAAASTQIVDLSATGAQVRGTPEPLHSEVQLQFHLPNSLKPMAVRGKVVWAQSARYDQSPGREETMGIVFTNLSPQDQAQLRLFLESVHGREEHLTLQVPTGAPERAADFPVTDEEIDRLLQDSLK